MNPLDNTGLMFSLAILLGFLLPQLSSHTRSLVVLSMVVAMCLSLRQITFSKEEITQSLSGSLKAFLVNYGFQTGLMVGLAFLFVPNFDFFAGFIIMAAMPPAIMVIPFTFLFRGDVKTALGGEVLSYLLALGLTPAITLLLIGFQVNVIEILKLSVLLIIAPLVISILLRRLPDSFFSPTRPILNLCFALNTYTFIGLNQRVLLTDFMTLLPVTITLFLKTFAISILVFAVSMRFGAPRERAITYAFFSSYKNESMAATFALVLVSAAASLPAVIQVIYEILFVIFFGWYLRRTPKSG